MSQTMSGSGAHKVLAACATGLAIQFAATAAAWAQATPNAPGAAGAPTNAPGAAGAPNPAPADGAPSEAARRAALSPYRFILQHSSAPARKPAPAPAPVAAPQAAPSPAAPAEARRSTPEPALQSAARTSIPAPAPAAPEAAAAPASVPAAEPAPTPVAAARVRAPEPPPPRREIIPVRTDEPRLSAALMRERPNGVVRVQFEVHPDGSTHEVKVLSSSNRSLNRATVDAISAWKFQPVDEVLTVETEIAYKYD